MSALDDLERRVLTPEQREALSRNDRFPRWHLDPPQREEYYDDRGYFRALALYADRVIAEEQSIGSSVTFSGDLEAAIRTAYRLGRPLTPTETGILLAEIDRLRAWRKR